MNNTTDYQRLLDSMFYRMYINKLSTPELEESYLLLTKMIKNYLLIQDSYGQLRDENAFLQVQLNALLQEEKALNKTIDAVLNLEDEKKTSCPID